MNAIRCRPVFLLLLLLVTGMAVDSRLQNTDRQTQTLPDNPGYLQRFVPERLRSFVAACVWAKADEMMHRGPFPGSRQTFQAGSYVGNADMVPLLNIVIAMMPEELAPYQLLSRCLSSLGSVEAGLRILQNGIVNNRQHAAVHELYASAAFLKLFSAGKPTIADLRSAGRYLERAIACYNTGAIQLSSDPAFKPENYQILLARIFVELSEPQKALEAWQNSGQNLELANDRLAIILRDYREHGSLPQNAFPAFLNEQPPEGAAIAMAAQPHEASEPAANSLGHERHAVGNEPQMQAPPELPLKKVLLAGFWLGVMLLLRRFMIRG
ncbi:MAG TPA: hypothetical protein PLM07_00535 [Candidatus Rifleibacterium sp.]|nr:hypothetical protein [Candidatus Rifleibacterium sp.]HPT44366.1 hypothetical protein [Candidatus Rifleibacterium sp.]